jgi:thiol-disulfide isomerase/thioredoxin
MPLKAGQAEKNIATKARRMKAPNNKHQITNKFQFAGLFFIIWALFGPTIIQAGQNDHVKILYYFSMTCRHCIDAKPAVIALSKEYSIEGRNVGTLAAQGYPFPIKTVDKKTAKEVYGITGVPALAVLIDGVYKQKIAGASDIQDAKTIIKALSLGAMTVTEAKRNAKDAEITITGWVISQGEYFKNARFLLTDRTTEIPVKAWLPLEAVKSPLNKTTPRLMSSVIRKPAVLKGSFKQTETGSIFLVKEELPLD